MVEILLLSGAGRFADPWHPFARTSQQLADLLTEQGHRVRISTEVEERLADLDGVDLLVLNAGNPTTLGLSPTTELTPAARKGLLNYLRAGKPLLAMHISVNSLPGIPEWPDIIGATWVEGQSMHPPIGATEVTVHSDRHSIVHDLQDFSLTDERYSQLPIAADVIPLVSHVHAGVRHPLFWARRYGRARVVYDALGHGPESYDAPGHRELLTRAVRWLTSSSENTAGTTMSYTSLHSEWTVCALAGPVPDGIAGLAIPASVPGCVHTDLLAADLIADPFDGSNETGQQWIGDTSWRFESHFDWADDGSARHDLVAQGLDTIATVEINGTVIAHTENQHRSYRFDISDVLVTGRNSIAVEFAAPVPAAEARSAAHDPRPHVNHHPFNAIRKMACNFGWDWGIDVATCGIWRPIGIESWSDVRIASVRPLVGIDGTAGVLTAHVELERATGLPTEITVTVGGRQESMITDATSGTVAVRVPDVDRWWPIGHGAQPLYEVVVSAVPVGYDAGHASIWTGRVGFRTVELNVEPDDGGTPFELRVNGETIQVRGANWIPDHAFLTEIDADRYARRIDDAVEANMNLLRVWGGGIYESPDFYARCDELGILVWQDFLFACAAYAEEAWLSVEVEAEARAAITRLSVHPSLVIWNGNNENIWGYADWGWRPLLAGRTWGNGYYRELLPGLLAELDPTRPYSPGSPYSFTEYLHPNDENNGTMHIWDVWNKVDYTVYRDYTPRFVSEFGFQGPPAWSTLTRVVHDQPLDPYGPEMLIHQKAEDGNLKLERGLRGHLPSPTAIEDWHFATQLNQANAIRFGIEHFRSLAPHNSGSVVWQLNDNWPVVSWAAVDFDEHRKPLWYALREAFSPSLATIQPRAGGLSLILLNDTPEPWAGSIGLTRQAFDGTVLASEEFHGAVDARGIATLPLSVAVATPGRPSGELLIAEFTDSTFARAMWNFAEIVDQDLDTDPIHATAATYQGGYLVSVTAGSYVRDVTLQVDRVDPLAVVDSALITLLAGETSQFHITSARQVDPSEYLHALVLRHANGLRKAADFDV